MQLGLGIQFSATFNASVEFIMDDEPGSANPVVSNKM